MQKDKHSQIPSLLINAMFNLIRRISGVFPPLNSSWRDQSRTLRSHSHVTVSDRVLLPPDPRPTPHHDAPQIGRKRRRSSTLDPDDDIISAKKSRSTRNIVPEADKPSDPPTRDESPTHRAPDTEEVKEVTKGVKEVDLEHNPRAEEPSSPEESATTETEPCVAPEDKGGPTTDDASKDADPPQTRDEDSNRVEPEPIAPIEPQSTLEIPPPSDDKPETPLLTDDASPENPTRVTTLEHESTTASESTIAESSSGD